MRRLANVPRIQAAAPAADGSDPGKGAVSLLDEGLKAEDLLRVGKWLLGGNPSHAVTICASP